MSRCSCLIIRPPGWLLVLLVAASLYIMFGLSSDNLFYCWITFQLGVLAAFLGRRQVGLALIPKKQELLLFERQFLAHLLKPSALLVLFHFFQGLVTSLPVVSVLALLGLGIPWSQLLMSVSVLRDTYSILVCYCSGHH